MSCLVLATGLAAAAPSLEIFGLLRFIAGLGLGGLLPMVSALTLEYAPEGRRNRLYGVMFSGYPFGGLLAALLAVVLIPGFGFRVMPLLGLAGLLAVPLVVWYLCEASWTVAARRSHRCARSPNYSVATCLFWRGTFLCLLLVYGLYTRLPEIMRQAGYSLGPALIFLLALNLGGIFGMLAATRSADRFGLKKATAVACLLAAVSIALLSPRLPVAGNYLIVLASTGAIGAQVLINSYVGQYYPPAFSATALGWSLGVGRVGGIVGPPVGALIVGSALAVSWNCYVYALVAFVAAAALIVAVPSHRAMSAVAHDSRCPSPRSGAHRPVPGKPAAESIAYAT